MNIKLPTNYNTLTPSQRRIVRERYCNLQDNKCYHCKESLSSNPAKSIMNKSLKMYLFPKGFLTRPIHLHHCHKTGMTIGAVHARCNAVLWQYHGE